ncbi:hypothetical protein GUJ93_ZPchr0012g19236 [Zizania palustris]|uniref:Uncharacterized protein n=1 Tax=Zizania palustris TaxID=103762 RepID=A0A8J6BP26_ZIZPA|nr:hypothetical protein GUJ93_ZPchr0012g19236 [Zizania palustris]
MHDASILFLAQLKLTCEVVNDDEFVKRVAVLRRRLRPRHRVVVLPHLLRRRRRRWLRSRLPAPLPHRLSSRQPPDPARLHPSKGRRRREETPTSGTRSTTAETADPYTPTPSYFSSENHTGACSVM